MATSVALNRIGETHPAHVPNWEMELRGARMLLASGLVPEAIKTPEAAMFLILIGRDLGLSPVQSLRSIHVIKGKVEVAADMQLGLFHRAGGRSHWKELTTERAVIVLQAPWLTEPHPETFTIEDARRAKLGGDNWQKYPKAMLRSRAITAGLKSVGFDPTAGVYDYGELGGEEVPPIEEPATVEPGDADQIAERDESEPTADDVLYATERQALIDLEAMLPNLAPNQREYVKRKLRDGEDPVALLETARTRYRGVGQDGA